jgi:O-antigen/teichoic acid export membrane protein
MSDIAKKTFETFAVRVCVQLCAAGGAVVIARTFSPTGKGEFTYACTILGLILMGTVGHNKAVLWQYHRRGVPSGSVIRAMVLVVAAVSAPLVLAVALIGSLVSSQSVLLYVAAAIPFAIFSASAVGIFLGDGDVRRINIVTIFATGIAAFIYVPLILLVHRSLSVALIVWAAGYAAAAVYVWLALKRYRHNNSEHADTKQLMKEQMSFGSQACLSSLGQYLDFRIDAFLVIYMLGTAALGVYSVGLACGEFIWQLSNAMINPSLRDIGGADRARAVAVTTKCMRHSFLLVFGAALLVALLVRIAVPFIYGPAFSYGAVVTLALLPGIVAYSMMPALAAFFLQQLGEPRTPSYFSALSMAVCAIITFLTLPRFGIVAAAVATSISYTLAFVAAAIYFVRRTGISVVKIFALSADDLRPYYILLNGAVGAIRGRL